MLNKLYSLIPLGASSCWRSPYVPNFRIFWHKRKPFGARSREPPGLKQENVTRNFFICQLFFDGTGTTLHAWRWRTVVGARIKTVWRNWPGSSMSSCILQNRVYRLRLRIGPSRGSLTETDLGWIDWFRLRRCSVLYQRWDLIKPRARMDSHLVYSRSIGI